MLGSIDALAATYKATLLHPEGMEVSMGAASSGDAQVGAIYGLRFHAALWHGTADSVVDLHPAGFDWSIASAVFGDHQVGMAWNEQDNFYHAHLWHGTAESAVDLHPKGAFQSEANGVSVASQVGSADDRAVIWHGTAESMTELHPAGFSSSAAFGVFGNSQVGFGKNSLGSRALLWHGTAESVIELHPADFAHSGAYGVFGDSQVGWGDNHALLWRGTAESVADLHPAGFGWSVARSISAEFQVGYGFEAATGFTRALLWNGSAESAHQLHPYLAEVNPALVVSWAEGVSPAGDVIGTAMDGQGRRYAVLWTPTPEPASLVLVGWAAGAFAFGRCFYRRSANGYVRAPAAYGSLRLLGRLRSLGLGASSRSLSTKSTARLAGDVRIRNAFPTP